MCKIHRRRDAFPKCCVKTEKRTTSIDTEPRIQVFIGSERKAQRQRKRLDNKQTKHFLDDIFTWKTVKIAQRRESKFFLEHSKSRCSLWATLTCLQNLQPNKFIPKMLQKQFRIFSFSFVKRLSIVDKFLLSLSLEFVRRSNFSYLKMKMNRSKSEKNVATLSIVRSITTWKQVKAVVEMITDFIRSIRFRTAKEFDSTDSFLIEEFSARSTPSRLFSTLKFGTESVVRMTNRRAEENSNVLLGTGPTVDRPEGSFSISDFDRWLTFLSIWPEWNRSIDFHKVLLLPKINSGAWNRSMKTKRSSTKLRSVPIKNSSNIDSFDRSINLLFGDIQ